MKQTSKNTAKSLDERITVWFELDAECDVDEGGQENVEKWLADQTKECAEFETEHPMFIAAGGDGNSVSYTATAKQFVDVGYDVEIE